jgi:hypothetical protein
MDLQRLRFPIGEHQAPEQIGAPQLAAAIDDIADFPRLLRQAVEHLSDADLDTRYRPGGWTLRQVVHHCADSHSNSYTRFKLALTEDRPTIKPYDEALWAELPDSLMPIAPSLNLLEGLHARWAVLLRALAPLDFRRPFLHPEHGRDMHLDEVTLFYAWHCRHHLAHILNAPLAKRGQE